MTTETDYRTALRGFVEKAPAEQVSTINALVEVLCDGEDDLAHLETAYAYFSGKADWSADARELL
jgi:hypothetical protein